MSEFVRTVSGKIALEDVMIEADVVEPVEPVIATTTAEQEEDAYHHHHHHHGGGGGGSASPEADEVFGNHHPPPPYQPPHQHHQHQLQHHHHQMAPSTGNVIDEIPEEQDDDDNNNHMNGDDDDDDTDDEESLEDDYEYEDEDDAAVSGFLVDNPVAAMATISSSEAAAAAGQGGGATKAPTKIEEDNETTMNHCSNSHLINNGGGAGAGGHHGKPKWRQPTEAAVNMSLRAEKETSGGKRRLAQDLFRIMNQDTEEAGFALRPSNEDSMDKWTIQLFQFDAESNLAKDMKVLGLTNVELEMSFPDQYPFEPPFVRVLRPRFKRQTGFVMNGALCMELLTKDGWNPINDIESVIVSIRSLLVVGDGRLEAAAKLSEAQYQKLLKEADLAMAADSAAAKRQKTDSPIRRNNNNNSGSAAAATAAGGSYSVTEAKAAYDHLSDYHKKKGWDTSGWWAKKG